MLPDRIQRVVLLAGTGAVLLAVLFNKHLLAWFFAPDGEIEFPNSALIFFCQLCLGLWGALAIWASGGHSKLRALVFGIAVAACVLALLEVSARLLCAGKDSVSLVETPRHYIRDMDMGFRLRPNTRTQAVCTAGGDTLYEALYHIDGQGRRVVPGKKETGSGFLLLLGGSYVFGAGLNDDQTLAYYMQEQLPSWRVYNLGVGGYGTNQVYAQLSSDALEDEIGRDSGTGVYVFIDDHLFRNIGSMRVYNLWGRDMPYYCVEGDGLKRKGTFTTGRRWRSFIYNLLGKSRMLKCAGFDWPKAGPEDLLLTARLIRGCADAFHNQFPGSRFAVVFYPGSKFAPQLIELLKAEGGQGLVILDYSRLFDRKDRRFVIEGDGHPSAFANQTLAGQLIKDLGVAAH